MPNLTAVTKKKKKKQSIDKISLLNYSVGSHILSMAHDTDILSLKCFNMYSVLKLNRLLERKHKSILAVTG